MKTALKEQIRPSQNRKCAISNVPLPEDTSLFDTDRVVPKANGGTYTLENTRLLNPVVHMKRHDAYREREKEMAVLKSLIDAREQLRKLLDSANNRLLAVQRGIDILDKSTCDFLEEQINVVTKRLSKQDRLIKKEIESSNLPIAKSALGVKGVGTITIAYMIVYVDIHKANYCSSLWSYVGLDKPSHKRYTKGVAGGGNKTLRTILYTMADSQIKTRGAYRDVYDRTKKRLSASEKITKSYNTQGKMIECAWKDTKPSHRHGAALRNIMKHFLADWWYVHRKTEGLETAQSYAIEKLGHKTWIYPQERGWTL